MQLKTRVLVADDSHSIRVYLRQRLEEEGFQVVVAQDGLAAIDMIRESAPDMAILDINMPHAGGFQVSDELQRAGNAIPIIFLTSENSHAVQTLCQSIGSYIQKPVTGQKLIRTVHDILALQN